MAEEKVKDDLMFDSDEEGGEMERYQYTFTQPTLKKSVTLQVTGSDRLQFEAATDQIINLKPTAHQYSQVEAIDSSNKLSSKGNATLKEVETILKDQNKQFTVMQNAQSGQTVLMKKFTSHDYALTSTQLEAMKRLSHPAI